MKALKIIGIVIGSILLIVLAIVIALSIALSDSTDHTPESIKAEDPPLIQIVNEIATRSLSSIQEQPDVEIKLDGDTINRALYAVLTRLKGLGALSFKGAYASFTSEGALYVEIPTHILFANSCLYAEISINDDNENLSIQINDLRIGRFDCHSFPVKALLLTDQMSQKIEHALLSLGLTMDIDLKALHANVTHRDLATMISSLTEDDPNGPLYSVLANLCLTTPELLEIVPNTSSIAILLHTQIMTYDKNRDGELRFPLDILSIQSKVDQSDPTFDSVTPLYHYYIQGYSQLNEQERALIDSKGYSNKEKGIRIASGLDIAGAMLTQRPNLTLLELVFRQSYSVLLEAKTVDAILGNLPFIGSCIAFTDGHESAFLAVEGLSVAFDNHALHICLIINANGRRISLVINGECPDGSGESLDVQINRIAFGDFILSENYIELILKYLSNILSSQTWLTPRPQSGTISVSLAEVLGNLEGFDLLRSNCDSTSIGLEPDQLRLTYHFFKKA